uniref:Uncharacterized protein n=1 Tax=Anguilla anguilla TaxID=7936 RepID=A0A0E9WWV9_ANGAN
MHAIFIVIQPALYHRISLFLSLRIVLLFTVLKWLQSTLQRKCSVWLVSTTGLLHNGFQIFIMVILLF